MAGRRSGNKGREGMKGRGEEKGCYGTHRSF